MHVPTTCLRSIIQIMTVPIWKTSREKKAICLSSFQTKKPELVTIVYCASTCCTFENINASLFQMILKNRGSFFAFELFFLIKLLLNYYCHSCPKHQPIDTPCWKVQGSRRRVATISSGDAGPADDEEETYEEMRLIIRL